MDFGGCNMINIMVLLVVILEFEVNTHQALTRCVISNSCSNGTTQNLENFVNHGDIKSQSYGNEAFENYGKTYQVYTQDGIGFDDWKITIINSNYLGMIEVGSGLEVLL